ncbi:hypothetical protein ACFFX0_05150 [Citricoccus parietis]|uniref:Uncharacterized protein n=1 Tax=Citricoccus parietis TaxID=592307 RepID=A0ABV5FVX8_9MICC
MPGPAPGPPPGPSPRPNHRHHGPGRHRPVDRGRRRRPGRRRSCTGPGLGMGGCGGRRTTVAAVGRSRRAGGPAYRDVRRQLAPHGDRAGVRAPIP